MGNRVYFWLHRPLHLRICSPKRDDLDLGLTVIGNLSLLGLLKGQLIQGDKNGEDKACRTEGSPKGSDKNIHY